MVEGIITFDLTGEFYFANAAAVDLYGFEQAEEILKPIDELEALFEFYDMDGEALPKAEYPAARLLRGDGLNDYQLWVKRRGDNRRWVACYNGTQIKDSFTLCVMSVRDVTVQHELEARHRATFEISPTAMSIIRLEDLRFTEVNESFLKLTGYSRAEVIGKTALELGLLLERDKRDLALQQIRLGHEETVIEHEAILRTKSGNERTIISEGQVIRFDSDPYLIDTYLDITERKRAEGELVQAVQAVMRDPAWFVRVVQDKLLEIRSGTTNQPGLELLSKRETQVLELMARGMNNEEIARALSLAVQTVRNYISTIYDKIGVHSRAEAVIWARERGLIFPE